MLKLGVFSFLSLLLVTHPTLAGKEELEAIVRGNGLFTNQLYKVLAKKPNENVFFSPISVHAVLAMSHQGAKGKTYDDIATVLHVPNAGVAAEGYKDILGQLNNIPNVTLSMANKIFIMEGIALKPAFQEVNEKKLLSSVEAVNFADSGVAAGKINGWVEEQTKNKIKDLIKPHMVDALTRLVLVNAIYFKGNWATKFETKNTKSEKFFLNDNDSVDVQMMNIKATFLYKRDLDLDAQVLELPYTNRDVSFIVILPHKRNGIAELEKKLVDYDLTNITQNMYEHEVLVKLPKFKIETEIGLRPALSQLGLGIIFDPVEADFSDMLESSERLSVSEAIQKAFIEVNEEGTEAAAATAFIYGIRSYGGRELPEEFFADHPFVAVLAYKKRTILFHGRIYKPVK